MRMIDKVFTSLVLAAVVSVVCPNRGVAAAPTASQLLPTTTVAYIATDDVHRLDADWKRSRIAKLFDDAKMRPFLDAANKVDGASAAGSGPSAVMSWDDLVSIASGPASMAIVAVKRTPTTILLVDAQGKRERVVALMKRIGEAQTNLGAKRTFQTLAGQRAVVYEREVKDGKKTHKVLRVYFLRDGIFGVTDNLALLADVFTRWEGTAKDDLENLAAFRSIRRTASEGLPKELAQASWFLDPFGYQKLVRGPDKPKADDGWQRLARQGFAGIKAIGGSVSFAAAELDAVHHLAVYAPSPLKMAAGALAFEPLKEIRLPDWIPADVGRVAVLNWDLSAAFTAYGSWFDDVYGEGEAGIFEEVVLGIRDDPGAPGVDLRKDLLANLTGPLIVVGGAEGIKATSGDPVLLAIKTKSESRVRSAIDKMLSGDPDVDRRDVGPVKAWVFRDTSKKNTGSATAGESLGPDLSKVAACFHAGYLLVATDVELLKAVLAKRADGKSLTVDERYVRAIRGIDDRLGGEIMLRQFANSNVDLRMIYEKLRTGKIQDITSLRGRMIEALVEVVANVTPRRDLPLAKLPAFDVVRPYLGTGGMIGRRNDDGWSILSFTFAEKAK
jgi:hypothetical protein